MGELQIDPEAQYAALVETLLGEPEVTQEGKGFGAASLKIKGKIFAMLVKDKLVVKLPRARVDALIAAGQGERFDPRKDGRLMKEWIVLETILPEEWLALAKEGLEFVAKG